MIAVATAPAEVVRPQTVVAEDRVWVTIVWNDPVNLMSYVTFVFMEYFRFDRATAERLMRQVHEEGRAVVSAGTHDEMERDVTAMHGYGLWATLQQDS